jgi:hypothetical protein
VLDLQFVITLFVDESSKREILVSLTKEGLCIKLRIWVYYARFTRLQYEWVSFCGLHLSMVIGSCVEFPSLVFSVMYI